MWNTENRHIRCLSVLIGQGRTNIYYLSPDEYTVILVFNLLLPHLSLCYTQDGWIENTCNGFFPGIERMGPKDIKPTIWISKVA